MSFDQEFYALTSHTPLSWQRRLFAEHFARGSIPDALDIPTGLGKTSVMAIWLLALDLYAENPLPRRLVYVVDRRAVVDQATDEAKMLTDALGDGTGQPIDPLIANIRRRLRLEPGQTLPVSTLRGQLADAGAWLDDPSGAAIVVGTVDMIGSRILFQGYDTSPRMRPMHAALLGVDALILLDEAHLAPPFEALLRQVIDLGVADQTHRPVRIPGLKMLTLSATGREMKGATFRLQPEDRDDDERVRQRLDARKRLGLDDVSASADMAAVMAQRAWERSAGGRRVVVFTDSRKRGQQVYEHLEKRLKEFLDERFGKRPPKPDGHLALMVGARRVREREKLAESEAFRRFSPKTTKAAAESEEGMPAFLVATSAGEVGVDIDADHAVCDLVAWERMVQRLGRVNRLGKFTEGSLVDVFVAMPEKDAEAAADAREMTERRAPFECPVWPVEEDGRRNASPGALLRLRENAEFKQLADEASTEEPLRPALTRPLVDAWSMTSAPRHTGRPEVAPWIRGWIEEEPQTRAVWRAVLPIRPKDSATAAIKAMNEWIDVAPPHLSEVLETYTSSMVELLRKRARALTKGQDNSEDEDSEAGAEEIASESDDGEQEETAGPDTVKPSTFTCVVLAADRKVEQLLSLKDLETSNPKRLFAMLAGRTVILDARIAALAESGLLDAKERASPKTLDENAVAGASAPDVPPLWDDGRLEAIGFRVRRVRHGEAPMANWEVAHQRFIEAEAEEAGGDDALEWRVEAFVGGRPARNEPAMTKVSQTLADHHADARRWAERIADTLRLPAPLRQVLIEAGGMHDSGKARRNWQAFAGNPRWARDPRNHPALAKFRRGGGPALLKIGDQTYRHEFGSLHDVAAQPALVELIGEEWRDLFLHVLAAHHGNARPVIAAADEQHPPEICAAVAREAALRFVRVQKQFGPWGLAWIEALLRAADVGASREFSARGGEIGAPTTKEKAA